MLEDDKIVQLLRENNSEALEFVIKKYGKLIYTVILKVLKREKECEMADECFNDVLLTLWKSIKNYDSSRSSFKNFIVVVSKYKAIDMVRRAEKINTHEILIEEEEKSLSDEYEVEVNEGFYSLIENLEAYDREIFIRKYLLLETVEKIAKDLNKNPDSIYMRLSRGRKKLKGVLEGV